MNLESIFKKKSLAIQRQYSENLFPKIFAGWALLTFLISFNSFFGDGLLSTYSSHPCFPSFQGCKSLFETFNLIPLPYAYGESVFFTILFGIIVLGAFYIYKKEYFKTHVLLWLLLAVKTFIVVTNYGVGNFDYYDIVIIFVFLIYPSRIDLVKLTLVILYFLASTIKIHEGWILGTYFSSLVYGLPLIPDALIPLAVNVVTIMQIVGCWFLLSKNRKISDYTMYFFIFFHLYSTILVAYRYPITTVLSLLIIFVISRDTNYVNDFSLRKNTVVFYLFVVFLFSLQSIAILIPGDQKLTLEGNNYGLYMFEANHQCISRVQQIGKPEIVKMSYDSRNRCDPYIYLKSIQSLYCSKATTTNKVHWVFDHSINGEPLRRIVDEADVCTLVYLPFTHNTWIKTEKEAPIVGNVYKNVTLTSRGGDTNILTKDGYIFPSFLAKSSPVTKTALQLFLEKYIIEIKYFYWGIWFSSLSYALYILIKNTVKR